MSFNIKMSGDAKAIGSAVRAIADKGPSSGLPQEIASMISERMAKMSDTSYNGKYFMLDADGHVDDQLGGYVSIKFGRCELLLDKDQQVPPKAG